MKKIKKNLIPEVLKALSSEYEVIAPRRNDRGECRYDTYDEASFTLEPGKPSLPPKNLLFPQSEVIFRLEDGSYQQTMSEKKVLLFGLRACDLKAQLQSRSFMSSNFTDVYFEARARNTLNVVLACQGPQSPTCFCTTTRSGPWAESGYDLQLVDIGGFFLVDAGTSRGEEIASSEWFEDAGIEGEKLFGSLKAESALKIPYLEEVPEAIERLKENRATDDLWDRFGDKCITCGGCSFVCPTCTCFSIYDKVSGSSSGERVRTWDACLYAGFTKEASGHNPRKTQGLRLQRRHEHKLRYYADRDNHGALCTCVGCGRCSDSCPVHIGTIEVARAIRQEKG